MDEASPQLVEIGHFGRAHGIAGEIRLFTDDSGTRLLEEGFTLWVDSRDGPEPMTIEKWRSTGSEFGILKLAEVDDRTAAEQLTNRTVWVAADALPEPDNDEFYLFELEGCEVYLTEADGDSARQVGTVDRFFATGANDVMVVLTDEDDEVFVPMIESAIASIRPEEGRVTLQPLDQWAPDDTEL